MKPHDTQDSLQARYHRAAPEFVIDSTSVLRAGRRRRSVRTVGAIAVATFAMGGTGWAVTSLPLGDGTVVATQEPTEGQESREATDQVLALADEIEANAQPVPEGMAFHLESRDWLVSSNQVQVIGLERTSNPDGSIYQVELQSEQSSELAVGDPMPASAMRTETGSTDQGRPDWAFEQDLPLEPEALREAWVDGCVDESVGDTEYRCVYVGMQDAVPIATDDLAAAVLRMLAAEPGVEIEPITDRLGRERIGATFDLPEDGLWTYLINPETGRIDGMQTSDEHTTSVGTFTTEWVEPVDS